MLIDWFTVTAQVVNFLILVWLLKHFLYRPILDAIEARENRIAKELADANSAKAEAQKERDTLQSMNQKFDSERVKLMTQVQEEAKIQRQRLLNEARKAADALSEKRKLALRQETETLNQSIVHRVQQEVFSIARKALRDLAGTSLEARMSHVFIQRLQDLDEKTKAAFGVALKSKAGPTLVRTAFDLPAELRSVIQNALDISFAADIAIRFETAPDLISGIELTSNGQKLAWNIADYLVLLQKEVGELLLDTLNPLPNLDTEQGTIKHGA